MSLYPNEMVPLQIDRAIDAGRYLEAATVNLADRDPAGQDAGDCNHRAPIRDCECAAGRSCGGVRLGIGVDGLTPWWSRPGSVLGAFELMCPWSLPLPVSPAHIECHRGTRGLVRSSTTAAIRSGSSLSSGTFGDHEFGIGASPRSMTSETLWIPGREAIVTSSELVADRRSHLPCCGGRSDARCPP